MIQGTRVYANDQQGLALHPSSYGMDSIGRWWVMPPYGEAQMVDESRVTVDETSGTITVAGEIPSVGRDWTLIAGSWQRLAAYIGPS